MTELLNNISNKIKQLNPIYKSVKYKNNNIKCFKCNKLGHMSKDCRGYKKECYKCGQADHYWKEYPKNINSKKININNVDFID